MVMIDKNRDGIYESELYEKGDSSNSAAPTYAPVIEQNVGGTISVNNKHPVKGECVSITPAPDAGYKVGKVIVTDKGGNEIKVTANEDGTFFYEQPFGRVTINVTFDLFAIPFTDVNKDGWFYEAVEYVFTNGFINGTSVTTFAPNMTTTRGMIVTILHRLEGMPDAGACSFTDVPAGQYYTDAVAWANENAIVKGYSAENFGPNDPITREQMASILHRYAAFKGYDITTTSDLAAFTDANTVSDWALDSVKWANTEKLINGRTATTLVPKGNATRAEVAQILMTFSQNVAKQNSQVP